MKNCGGVRFVGWDYVPVPAYGLLSCGPLFGTLEGSFPGHSRGLQVFYAELIRAMGFSETVEALKNQYTDKYVKVDAARPELTRFRDAVGQVKTVNMNGRALVEFLDYHLNTGWFDIDLSCLTV